MELSFDKRPVQGVRCEDPVIGAEKYNQGREKFKALASRHKKTLETERIDLFGVDPLGNRMRNSRTMSACFSVIPLQNDDDYQAMEFS